MNRHISIKMYRSNRDRIDPIEIVIKWICPVVLFKVLKSNISNFELFQVLAVLKLYYMRPVLSFSQIVERCLPMISFSERWFAGGHFIVNIFTEDIVSNIFTDDIETISSVYDNRSPAFLYSSSLYQHSSCMSYHFRYLTNQCDHFILCLVLYMTCANWIW